MSRRADDVPASYEWLTAVERETLAGLHVPKRRDDWLLGRWTAKTAVSAWLGDAPSASPSPGTVEIRPADDGAPRAFVLDKPAPVSISITHRARRAVVAVAAAEVEVGCDLEIVEERRSVFLDDYFTDAEVAAVRRLPEAGQPEAVTRLWAAKEATLKALREGLRIDTRRLEVHPVVPGARRTGGADTPGLARTNLTWGPMTVLVDLSDRARADRDDSECGDPERLPLALAGWWCRVGDGLLAIVADPPSPAPPRLL